MCGAHYSTMICAIRHNILKLIVFSSISINLDDIINVLAELPGWSPTSKQPTRKTLVPTSDYNKKRVESRKTTHTSSFMTIFNIKQRTTNLIPSLLHFPFTLPLLNIRPTSLPNAPITQYKILISIFPDTRAQLREAVNYNIHAYY